MEGEKEDVLENSFDLYLPPDQHTVQDQSSSKSTFI